MHKPSVVVFDLGKVLVDFDYRIAADKISHLSRFSAAAVQNLLDHSPLLYQFETGLIDIQKFYDEVRAASGFSGNLDEFCAMFADIFSEIKPMTALQAALRANHIPTYIFSNTNPLADRHIRARFPFFANFDGYVLSYQCLAMKPDAKIYEILENRTGEKGAQILYLDDRPENVQAGADRGWNAWLHQSPEKTIPVLRQLGLPIDP
jgi:HAD superfamily hydrolase (TIGR01509 family)